MREENFYPVSSERLLGTPKARAEKLEKEEREFRKEAPILEKLVEYLRQQADYYDRLSSISHPEDLEKFRCEVYAHQKIVGILKREIGEIEKLQKMFGKK